MHLVASFLKVEEDLQGSSQTKEETDGTELKQEPMEIEEKKPEIKVDAKEEEESGTNGTSSQSTSPSQPRKKSTCMKTDSFFLHTLFDAALPFSAVFVPAGRGLFISESRIPLMLLKSEVRVACCVLNASSVLAVPLSAQKDQGGKGVVAAWVTCVNLSLYVWARTLSQ